MWAPYLGRDAIALAVVLIVVAAIFAFQGTRLRRPIHVGSPGRTAGAFLVAIWALAICTFLVAEFVYLAQIKQVLPLPSTPRGQGALRRTGVGTLPDAAVTFFVILFLTRRYGWKVALASAFVGTAAAPMLFELPFDLIVMGRTYPAVPPNPSLYRALFFLPLFIVELSTISLLTLVSSMRVTRQAFFALAGMFVVFAAWAAFGFAPPTAPLPKTLNVVSKMLCFVTAIMLFIRSPAPAVDQT